ncbi:MAG: AAA family ATPase [Anaerolineae bacterium]
MIPLKLELTNFLSYRETATLDFSGIHLACISGLNGAGKSSILDGITWALFGKSRSKSDDDLVNRAAVVAGEGAAVSFTFDLEGSRYRVIRRKAPRKSTLLEFQVAAGQAPSGGAPEWKTLSESRIRETQAAIETLLRMNYETFINASFLLQGKADEFTTKTPSRRKEILAELIGVSAWDEYKETAAAKRREAEGKQQLLDGQLAEIEQELAEEPERKKALATAQARLEEIVVRLADKEKLQEQLRRAEAAVKQQRQMVQNLADNLAQAKQTLARLRQTQQARQRERDTFQAILAEAAAITADHAAWQTAEAELRSWQEKAEAYNRRQQAKRPHELAVAEARSRLRAQQKELAAQAEQAEAAAAEKTKIAQEKADGHAWLEQLTADLAALAEQEQQWHEARSRLDQLEGERNLLAQELAQLQTQQRRVEAAVQERAAVARNREEAAASLAELTTRIEAVAEQHRQHAAARAEMDTLRAEQPRLREQMNKAKERIDRLEAETGGECPLCGQPLSESHRKNVLDQLRAEGKEMGDRFRANQERIAELEAEVSALESTLRQRDRLERDQRTQQERLARAEARLHEIEQVMAVWEASGHEARIRELAQKLADEAEIGAEKARMEKLAAAAREKAALEAERREQQRRVSGADARLTEIGRLLQEWETSGRARQAAVEQQLAEEAYAPQAQAALAELEAQLSELGYDAAAHEAAREKVEALSAAPARYQSLKEAEAAVKPLETTLADLAQQIAGQEQTIAGLSQQHAQGAAELERLATDGGDLRAVEQEVIQLREEEVTANRQVGAAQQRLAVLDDQREREEKLTAERAVITQRIQRLKLLEKACGRDGVQALLIEQALPEIEERANELLDRLTAGEMRIHFETQKQLKSRDATAETLDIHIVDTAGERPYANYSGGEQFRVNFAIRLALSQVLARRAGARLQTLVIDEGFGSQDPAGRQRLVEAIHAIQDDFARILVITHIDELRDAFPTRIEVEKQLTGSTIMVS